MQMKKSTSWSTLTMSSLGTAVCSALSATVLTAAPVQAVHAEASCAAAWNASTIYTAGNLASENGINYVANWWTQGNNPVSNNGGPGSGQPWTSEGACSGGSPTP